VEYSVSGMRGGGADGSKILYFNKRAADGTFGGFARCDPDPSTARADCGTEINTSLVSREGEGIR